MKLFLALMGAMTLIAFAYAQNTTCSAQDLAELENIAARFNACRSSLPCPQDQAGCACCKSVLMQSTQSNLDSLNCCREFQTGLALYQQCRATLNNSRKREGTNTGYVVFFQNCFNFTFGSGAKLIQAISAMTTTAVALLAYFTL